MTSQFSPGHGHDYWQHPSEEGSPQKVPHTLTCEPMPESQGQNPTEREGTRGTRNMFRGVSVGSEQEGEYRVTSLIQNTPFVGPYRSIYLGPYSGPRWGCAVSYERGTPVPEAHRKHSAACRSAATPCSPVWSTGPTVRHTVGT